MRPQNSGWAKTRPAHLLVASLLCFMVYLARNVRCYRQPQACNFCLSLFSHIVVESKFCTKLSSSHSTIEARLKEDANAATDANEATDDVAKVISLGCGL